MKRIPLTQGYFAIVDDADYKWLSQWSWHILKNPNGTVYATRNSKPDKNGKRHHIMMHREIKRTPKNMECDHRHGNGLDNRRKNLRNVTRNQNQWNRRANRKGSSKYKGVCWHKQHGKWYVAIQQNKRKIFLGLFADEEAAGDCYAKKAAELFKNFNREDYYGFKKNDRT